nr:uncharacterized protein LOC109024368 [Gorilla gorilla gorilla]
MAKLQHGSHLDHHVKEISPTRNKHLPCNIRHLIRRPARRVRALSQYGHASSGQLGVPLIFSTPWGPLEDLEHTLQLGDLPSRKRMRKKIADEKNQPNSGSWKADGVACCVDNEYWGRHLSPAPLKLSVVTGPLCIAMKKLKTSLYHSGSWQEPGMVEAWAQWDCQLEWPYVDSLSMMVSSRSLGSQRECSRGPKGHHKASL